MLKRKGARIDFRCPPPTYSIKSLKELLISVLFDPFFCFMFDYEPSELNSTIQIVR